MNKKANGDTLPNKYVAEFANGKFIYRKSNPLNYIVWLFVFLVLGVLLYFAYIQDEIFIEMIAFALAALPFMYAIQTDINTRLFEQKDAYCVRVEKIKLLDDKLVCEIKNIGEKNIYRLAVDKVTIDETDVIKELFLYFLPTQASTEVIANSKIESVVQVQYQIVIFLGYHIILFDCTQKMKLINDEYIIQDNTCVLRSRIYYRLRFGFGL